MKCGRLTVLAIAMAASACVSPRPFQAERSNYEREQASAPVNPFGLERTTSSPFALTATHARCPADEQLGYDRLASPQVELGVSYALGVRQHRDHQLDKLISPYLWYGCAPSR
jgi:hypothetical protein